MNSDSVIERLKAEIERLEVIIKRTQPCNHVHVTKGECWLRDHSIGNVADKHIYRSDLEMEATNERVKQILRQFGEDGEKKAGET